MSLPAVGSAANNATSGTSNSATQNNAAVNSAITSQLGPSAFLNLLTTQLANQDPLNPMDDAQSIAQLAQFSQVQATDNLQTSFTSFQQSFGVTQSAALIGKTVTVASVSPSTGTTAGTTTSVSGVITGVTVTNGVPSFTLKDASGNAIIDSTGAPQTFTSSQIVSIS